MTTHHHSFAREAFLTGLLGASAVALWFLTLDSLAGRPFSTPSILGQVILFQSGTPVASPIDWSAVAGYTALHVTLFLILGAVITQLTFLADRHGIVRFALVMLFLAFEFFFWGVLQMFSVGTGGLFPLWSVLGANTLAALVMGGYLYRAHPAIRRGLTREPLGSPPDPIATDTGLPVGPRNR